MEDFFRQKIRATDLPRHYLAKFPPDIFEEAFVPVPKRLLRALPKLFPDNPEIEELAALLSIVDFKRPNLSRDPSVDFLAFIAGMEPPQFAQALKRLQQKGLVRVEGNRQGVKVDLEPFYEKIREAAPGETDHLPDEPS
ncbi:MAG: hypothetical protein ACRERC_14800 [Candidatus Binatia bacterium]